jgi:hypothetical protein
MDDRIGWRECQTMAASGRMTVGLPAKPGGAHGYDWCALPGDAWAMMGGRLVVESNVVLRPLWGAPAVAVRRGESSSKPTDAGRFAPLSCGSVPLFTGDRMGRRECWEAMLVSDHRREWAHDRGLARKAGRRPRLRLVRPAGRRMGDDGGSVDRRIKRRSSPALGRTSGSRAARRVFEQAHGRGPIRATIVRFGPIVHGRSHRSARVLGGDAGVRPSARVVA